MRAKLMAYESFFGVSPLLAIALASSAIAQATPFQGTVADALSKSKLENRPVLVDVYASWCGPCHVLEKSVLATPEAAKATKSYLLVKVDGEGAEGQELAKKYHVVGYPTLLFLRPDGTEIDRLFEVPTLPEFVEAAKDLLAGKGTLEDAEARFASHAGDFELAYEIGFREAVKGHEMRAKAYFALVETARKGLKSTPKLPIPGNDPAKAEQIKQVNDLQQAALARTEELVAEGMYALAKYDYLRGANDYNKARIALQELRRQFPKSPVAKRALYDLALAFHGLKDDKQTRATLDQYLSENKGDPKAANAYAWFCFKQSFQLDRGIEVALAALEKDASDDGLWDTLAELYAAKGNKAKALEAAEKALSLKPDDDYYKLQKEKFAAK
jgi:thioredoxin-like negative regulator of GroEL